MNVPAKDFTVAVSGNTGEANTKTALGHAAGVVHGLLKFIGIIAPDASATYDLAIYDEAGHIIYGEVNIVGLTFSTVLEVPCNSPLRVVILNCSYAGSYSVRLRSIS